jgi:hypothetical protein
MWSELYPEILTVITNHFITGLQYKAVIGVCRHWHNAVSSPDQVRKWANVVSTIIYRHPEIKWKDNWSLAHKISPKMLDRDLSIIDNSEIQNGILNEIVDEHGYELLKRLPQWFIDKYPILRNEIFNRTGLLSSDFIRQHMTQDEQDQIVQNRDMTLDLIKKYCHKFNPRDWANISCDNLLDEAFIRERIDKLNWVNLSLNDSFNMTLITEYIDICDWSGLSLNVNLTPKFIREHWDELDKDYLVQNPAFTMEFITEYYDQIDKELLTENPNLTAEFIREHWCYIDYRPSIIHPSMTLDLILECVHETDYMRVLQNPNMTIEFAEEYLIPHLPRDPAYVESSQLWQNRDLVAIILASQNITSGADLKAIRLTCFTWNQITRNPQLTHQYMNVVSTLIMRHPEKRWHMHKLSRHITMDVAEKYLAIAAKQYNADTFRKYYGTTTNKKPYKLSYSELVSNHRITSQIVHKYNYLLQTKMIRHLTALNDDYQFDMLSLDDCDRIIEERKWPTSLLYDKVDDIDCDDLWEDISSCTLPEKFIRKYADKFNWYELSKNASLTLPLIREFTDKLNWGELCRNPNLTSEFILEHIDKFKDHSYIISHPQYLSSWDYFKEFTLYWHYISFNPSITLDFITTNIVKMSYDHLSQNRNLTPSLIRDYVDKWIWRELAINPAVSIEILEENLWRLRGKLYSDE